MVQRIKPDPVFRRQATRQPAHPPIVRSAYAAFSSDMMRCDSKRPRPGRSPHARSSRWSEVETPGRGEVCERRERQGIEEEEEEEEEE